MTTYVLDARTVTPHFPGIGRYVANLAPALAAQLDPNERLLVLYAPEARARLAGLAGPQVRLLATTISPFSLGQQLQLPRLLRETGGVDLYHSTYYLMPYSMRLPTVLTFYDLIPLQHPETVSRRARLMFRMTMGMALGVSAHVVSISEAARRDGLARFKLPPERITTTPLAADTRFCPQPPDEVARVRAAYDLPQEMVLFVGINKPHKNLVRLIEAFGRLLQKGSSATLVLAGPWDDRYPEAKAVAASMPGRLPGNCPPAKVYASWALWPTPTCRRSMRPPPFLCCRACTKALGCRYWRRWPAGRRWRAAAPPACPRLWAMRR